MIRRESATGDGKDKTKGRERRRLKVLELRKLGAGMHCDGDGLYLCVGDSGSRSWVLRTMVRRKRTDVGLGSLSTRSLAEAREEAAALRTRARKGEDILEQRRIQARMNRVPVFEDLARTRHGELHETFSSERHSYNWLKSLENHVFPVFGRKAVDKIESRDLVEALRPFWTKKPDTARRTLRRIKAVLDYATASGYRDIIVNGVPITMPNPCDTIRASLPKQKRTENHFPSLPYKELPGFIQELRVSNSSLSAKLCLEFLVLTCARPGEAIGTKWDEIEDLEGASPLRIVPAGAMKTHAEHRVPLSTRAVEILGIARQFNNGAIVFPGRYPGRPLSDMTMNTTMQRMGVDAETAVPHGFRSSFKTWAEETTDFDHLVIEASMAHAVRGIERHYLRTTFFGERRKLMQAWADFVTSAPKAKVVSIGR